ncbi:hypothetical protein [Pseudorhodobacter antarcticus]|uniref:hypothetical protein n=1 Tax=Pseudorhodobacter antarcticus TaxID=1077947 RepID=UPI0012E26105|nr:hypothetical protein [Pseudorhodobacter antarcticus]
MKKLTKNNAIKSIQKGQTNVGGNLSILIKKQPQQRRDKLAPSFFAREHPPAAHITP